MDDNVLERIDLLEGVEHGLYNRRRIPINCPVSGEKRNVWAYLYGGIVWTTNDDTTEVWEPWN